MDDDEIEKREFLDNAGYWIKHAPNDLDEPDLVDASFPRNADRFQAQYTSDQARILQIYLADKEESLDIQGFAGTGKTHLISAIANASDPKSLVIAAQTTSQLDALRPKLGNSYQYMTFGALANTSLRSNLFERKSFAQFRTSLDYKTSNKELFQKLNMASVGTMTNEWTAYAVNATVRSFCFSGANVFSEKNIPSYLTLSQEETAAIISMAERLWFITINPAPDDTQPVPLRSFHSIKQLSLLGEGLVGKYSTIIVDESHDLTIPMRQVLSQSKQAILSFGDRFQNLKAPVFQQSLTPEKIRQREMSQSFRVGKTANDLYNEILDTHPVPAVSAFEGTNKTDTLIQPYEQFTIPEKPTTFLSTDLWKTFKLVIDLHKLGANFYILRNTLLQLKQLISQCIELHMSYPVHNRHHLLRKINNWNDLLSSLNTETYQLLDSLFSNGFNHQQWEDICEKASIKSKRSYIVGLIEHSRNHEFESVVILPDSLTLAHQNKHDLSNAVNEIYTGISRAKHIITPPADLNGWLQDIRSKASH